MKPTTTPGGAQLIWLELGDALLVTDIAESPDGKQCIVWRDGDIVTERHLPFRPRRYIPLSPTT